MVRVGINGFGRIGRMVFRAGFDDSEIEFVGVNDLSEPRILAQLLKRDSTQGSFRGEVDHSEESLIVEDKEIPMYNEKTPESIPWEEHDTDLVVECTGIFRTRDKAEGHLQAGAEKVLLSAPPKDDMIKTFVLGVNDSEYDRENHDIVSNASCTTNCFAPMAKVLNDNFGIVSGFMETVHAYTGSQNLQDATHGDLRRARAAAENIIPTTSGAAEAVQKVIPELKGKVHSRAIRVPVPVGSATYFVCRLEESPSRDEVNDLFKNVSQHHLKNVLKYSEEPLVSSDIVHDPHSCIFDSKLTEIDGELLKVVGWYDNEWGYSCRMIDMAKLMFE